MPSYEERVRKKIGQTSYEYFGGGNQFGIDENNYGPQAGSVAGGNPFGAPGGSILGLTPKSVTKIHATGAIVRDNYDMYGKKTGSEWVGRDPDVQRVTGGSGTDWTVDEPSGKSVTYTKGETDVKTGTAPAIVKGGTQSSGGGSGGVGNRNVRSTSSRARDDYTPGTGYGKRGKRALRIGRS